ncbi:hypothetical protein [Photobacterium kagoshimensis]|uniref:hypothetical protein n=1 Tax=Photobacterium kagoshimensis TaxID=2910242 RepID=UPI003D0A559E
MKDFIENLGSGIFVLLFIGGYFPINMILSFAYGDKLDVAISFVVPFYGYFVMLCN